MAKSKKSSKKSKPKKDQAQKPDELSTEMVQRTPEEIDSEWVERLSGLKNRKSKLACDMLQFYYDVGLLAIELENEKAQDAEYRKYGAHSTEEAAVFLGMSQQSVYAAIKFATKCSTEELERMKQAEVPWRAVQRIIGHDDKERAQILTGIEQGEIKKAEDVPPVAPPDTGPGDDGDGDEKPKDNLKVAITDAKSFNTIATQTEAKALPGLVASVKAFKKATKERKAKPEAEEKYLGLIKEAAKHLATMRRLVDSGEKAIESL